MKQQQGPRGAGGDRQGGSGAQSHRVREPDHRADEGAPRASAAGTPTATITATTTALLDSGKVTGREARHAGAGASRSPTTRRRTYAEGRAAGRSATSSEGGTDPAMRTVLLQSYYLGNDCSAVNKMLAPASRRAASAPSEEELQILANCYLRQKDTGGLRARHREAGRALPEEGVLDRPAVARAEEARLLRSPGAERLSPALRDRQPADTPTTTTGGDAAGAPGWRALREAKIIIDKGATPPSVARPGRGSASATAACATSSRRASPTRRRPAPRTSRKRSRPGTATTS